MLLLTERLVDLHLPLVGGLGVVAAAHVVIDAFIFDLAVLVRLDSVGVCGLEEKNRLAGAGKTYLNVIGLLVGFCPAEALTVGLDLP